MEKIDTSTAYSNLPESNTAEQSTILKKNTRKLLNPLATPATATPVAGENYNFGYEIGDGGNSHKFHKEVGDGNGRKIGSYGFTDSDGRQRVVQYVADENGFRVQIKTNEPGTNTHEAAASLVQKRPTIVLLDDKDSPMTLPVKTPKTPSRLHATKRRDSLRTAPSFHSPVLPNGPVRMYDTSKSNYFTGPAFQSIEYKPHPKAIQIGPLLNVVGTPMTVPMQSPILPLGPVKMMRYEPPGQFLVPAKYQPPIPIFNNHVQQPSVPAYITQPEKFEALRIGSEQKIPGAHLSKFAKGADAGSYKFDPSKFNILSMYQTTLLPNGPKMYDGPVHAYVRAPPKGPPPHRLIYDESPRKIPSRRKIIQKKKVQLNSDENLQTTENGLELSQTIHDQSTVFYVPAEHAPPMRRRLAKPIFKKKRQPLQHGDGTSAQEPNSPLTGSKPVVYDDPVGDLKPVPLFKGASVTGFLPPSGRLAGPSEAYKLVRPPLTNERLPTDHFSSLKAHNIPQRQAVQHLLVQSPPTPDSGLQRGAGHPTTTSTLSQGGLVPQSQPSHPDASSPRRLFPTHFGQPPATQLQPVPDPASNPLITRGPEPFKIPSYPKLTDIERAAALRLAEQALYIQQPFKEVPLQTTQGQTGPLPQASQPPFPQRPDLQEAIQEVPAPNLSLRRPVGAISPETAPHTHLHEYFAKQAPTFLQNQEAIVNKYTNSALTASAPNFQQYKTTEASFEQEEQKTQFPITHHIPLDLSPAQPQIANAHGGSQSSQLQAQQHLQSLHVSQNAQTHRSARTQFEVPYHQALNLVGPTRSNQDKTAHSSPSRGFNHPPTTASGPSPQHFPALGSSALHHPPQVIHGPSPQDSLQQAQPISPSSQPRHLSTNSGRFANTVPNQPSLLPSNQNTPPPYAPPHPSQHLPPQVLPAHYQQAPVATYQPQQPSHQFQSSPLHALPQQIPPQHPHGHHQQALPRGPPQQSHHHLHHQPQNVQENAHVLRYPFASPVLQQTASQPLHLADPQQQQQQQQHRHQQQQQQQQLTHSRPDQHTLLPPSFSHHLQPRLQQFQPIRSPVSSEQLHHPSALSSSAAQPSPHLSAPYRPSEHLQPQQPSSLHHQHLDGPHYSPFQTPPSQLQVSPAQYQTLPPQRSLQSQASSQEHILTAQTGGLQAQAFVATEPRRPKSLADHSPFEYIKKSSR